MFIMTHFRIHRKQIRKQIRLCRLSTVLAVCALLLLTACGGDDTAGGNLPGNSFGSDSGGSNAAGSAQKREWAYVPEVIVMEDEHADYERMQLVGNTLCYVSQGADDGSSAKVICRYSLADRELESVPLDWEEGGQNWDVGVRFFDQDCNVYLTANVYPADYSSLTRFLCKFDPEGNCLFSRDITGQLGRDSSLDRLTVDRQGRLYLFADDGEIFLYTGEGEYHGSVSCSSSDSPVSVQVRGACDGADGKYYVCVSKGSVDITGESAGGKAGADARCTLMEIDFEGVRMSEVARDMPDIKGICAGKRQGGDSAGQGGNPAVQGGDSAGQGGDSAVPKDSDGQDDPSGGQYDFPQYDILLYDEKAVYGFDLAAWEKNPGSAGEELFSWMDSDINGYCVTNLYLAEDGRLCATVADWGNEDTAIVMLERTKADQAPQKEDLVLATVEGESNLAAMAVRFNRGNSQYHLTVKDYESLSDLYNAVLAKESIDLVDLSGINIQKLASQGFFEDLAPYVDQSEAFDRSDFVDGIMDVYTFDDQLVGIPASFTLRTVVGDGAQQELQKGLTLEELLAAEKRHPGAMAFDGLTKEEMMRYLMMFNENTFIDWDTGTCHFDSEAFQAVLEYVNQFPDTMGNSMEEPSLPAKIRNGEVLFAIAELNEFRAFQEYEGMFGGTAACVGFPTPDGQGGHLLFTGDAYGIAAASEHKDGAWKFIEDFLAQEKSDSYYGNFLTASFPTLKKVLNEKVEEAMERDSQYENDRFPETIYSDGTTFQFHALNWDEVNVMLNLVPDAKPYFDVEGDEVIQIISEEASGYYSGQRGAGDVAALIQNRVLLYVNENK